MARKIARLPKVEEDVGLKKSAIYELMKRGEFPRPIKLTARAVGWYEDEIEQWLASRPVAA